MVMNSHLISMTWATSVINNPLCIFLNNKTICFFHKNKMSPFRVFDTETNTTRLSNCIKGKGKGSPYNRLLGPRG